MPIGSILEMCWEIHGEIFGQQKSGTLPGGCIGDGAHSGAPIVSHAPPIVPMLP
jgi:hypothetical protein